MKITNLCVLAYAQSFTLWSYKNFEDRLDAILAPSYFGLVWEMFTPGDLIVISTVDGAAIRLVADTAQNSVVLCPLS